MRYWRSQRRKFAFQVCARDGLLPDFSDEVLIGAQSDVFQIFRLNNISLISVQRNSVICHRLREFVESGNWLRLEMIPLNEKNLTAERVLYFTVTRLT